MLKICYYASTKGKVRSNNEDCFQINEFIGSKCNLKKGFKILKSKNLISVCDGMGGEEFGEVASLLATKELARISNQELNSKDILYSINIINNLICEEMNKREVRIGSTLVSAVINDKNVDIYNVGDSRAYIYTNKLVKISKDHTISSLNGNSKGALTQHLGILKTEMEIEPFTIDNIELKKNNYLLLCSDGLYDMIDEMMIEEILSSKISDAKKRDRLLEEALKNGGKDNITFLLVRCY